MAKTLLVTGAAGFIGANFVHYWHSHYQHDRIIALDALTYVDISFNIKSVLWFFITTTFLYLFCSILFDGSSFFASNSIEDKASASSMMSFIYMLSAMISVIILGYLPFSSIVAFAGVITVFYLITFGLFLVRR